MNKNSLDIPAMSYTNKDFRSIYPEMLDLAKRLTNKWDPSKSNESDPGVVLLKEAAFVADHNNYNIDKNILEAFLPSATQDKSVRNITEMNGYTPRYYISANGSVTLKWTQPEDDTVPSFTIPAFTLVLSDAEDTISYTQVSDISITGGEPTSGLFIEGTLQKLSINDESTITLENLDDNNRLYFPETMIAQNGVYIQNVNQEDYSGLWERNNYLLTQPTGSHVYKIDYDSNKDLPYIEFPSDISNLIGDGLLINYITTSGESGNVSANTLTKIISPTEFYPTSTSAEQVKYTADFTVYNTGSILNGKNPETIEEMYQSFKKVVGTFDTLVTCKDYSNKIYTLADTLGNYYVSNSYVTDRRTDYNKSMNVITYNVNTGYKYFKNISIKPCSLKFKGVNTSANLPSSADPGDIYFVDNSESPYDQCLVINNSLSGVRWTVVDAESPINLNDFSILTEAMTPYDLVIYALKAFSILDYDFTRYSSEDKILINKALSNSFLPADEATMRKVKAGIEENKCICHTYNDPSGNDIFCFKNYAPLIVRIYLYNKIDSSVKNEILNEVYKAISENFNPRYLEFGEKLSVDDIRDVIINADPRIKDADVSLSYELSAMKIDGSDIAISNPTTTEGVDLLIDLVAKNTLAGRICLFQFDDQFNYTFGQVDGGIYKDINIIETSVPITLNNDQLTKKYYTSEVKRQSTTISSNGEEYYYVFSAPWFNQSELSAGASYVLRSQKDDQGQVVSDKFILYPTADDGEGGTMVLVDQAVVYEVNDTTTYTITNSLSSSLQNIIPEGSSEVEPQVLPMGELTVVEDDVTIIQQEGVLNLNYTLNENEVIQIIHPNYYSEYTYSMYVNYRYIGLPGKDRIYANTEHTLNANEKLVIIYSNDGVSQQVVYYPGEIIRSSFNIMPTDELTSSGVKKSWTDEKTGKLYENANFRQLSSNQTISTRKPMNTILESSGIWCYWIINSEPDGVNRLFSENEKTRILRSDEYFIYTNSSLNELMILGAGTMLTRTDNDDSYWRIDSDPLNISSITSNGTSVNIPWQKNIDFITNPFTITEMNVITLGSGDSITIFDWKLTEENEKSADESKYVINNNLQYCDGSIRYITAGSETVLPAIDNFYQIKSRLDINAGKNAPQRLYYKEEDPSCGYGGSVQTIILKNSKTPDEVIISSTSDKIVYIQTSRIVSALGDTINLDNDIEVFKYSLDNKDYERSFVVDSEGGEKTFTFFYNSSIQGDDPTQWDYLSRYYLIPIHLRGNATTITATIYETNSENPVNLNIADYNVTDLSAIGTSIGLDGDTSYYLCPIFMPSSSTGTQLTLKLTWDAATSSEGFLEDEDVVVGDITIIEGLNKDLNIGELTLGDVLNKISSLIAGSDSPSTKPYYPYTQDNSIAMDNLDFKDAEAVWDINNIINPYTIAQIDLSKSEFTIQKGMIISEKEE